MTRALTDQVATDTVEAVDVIEELPPLSASRPPPAEERPVDGVVWVTRIEGPDREEPLP